MADRSPVTGAEAVADVHLRTLEGDITPDTGTIMSPDPSAFDH